MYKELYYVSSKCYTNFITTEPFNSTKFLYKTGLKKLLIIAVRGLVSLKKNHNRTIYFIIDVNRTFILIILIKNYQL